MAGIEARHLAELTFPEVARALRALSSAYVERRAKLAEGAALSGVGKRAAFALFYGPLHYLLVRHIARQLPGACAAVPSLVDLGCGTGASGAAWAAAIAAVSGTRAPTIAIDRHPWAVAEARATYRAFGLPADVRRADVAIAKLARAPSAVLAAFTLNELSEAGREALLTTLVGRAARGDRLLVVEPLAGFVAPWWNRWRDTIERAGGRADEWRLRAALPAIVAKLDRAAGLHHREVTGRSLYLSSAGTISAP